MRSSIHAAALRSRLARRARGALLAASVAAASVAAAGVAAASLAAAGCVGEPGGGGAVPGSGTRARLASTLDLAVAPGSCRVAVMAEQSGQGRGRQLVDLPVLDGVIALRARPDGLVEVADLALHLDDVVLDEWAAPPVGARVTGITVTLREVGEAEATWDEAGGRLQARGQIDLVLDWSYVAGLGSEQPLGTEEVTAVSVLVEVSTTDDGKALVKVHGLRGGAFVQADGFVVLSDLKLELRAVG